MCGRYVMARAVGDLVAEAEAEADANLELRQSWNVAPTSDVPVVLERVIDGAAVRQVHVARWGLVPGWVKDISVGVRAFNARSETLLEKPTFREAVLARRCAVPMEGYYEWQAGPAGTRRPYFVRRADGRLHWFAGLYEWWADPALAAGDPNRWLLSASVITLASPEPDSADPALRTLGELHDRMPLPLSGQDLDAWIAPGALNATAALGLLSRVLGNAYAAAGSWMIQPASPAVGNVRHDGPWLLDADADPRTEAGAVLF
ncbi:SOS response-associated peptidase [Arthrobacter koreensis]|uniref:SOS response-associated peptidase n=1 Tax=Arthrobacter koreensis TaxID=199136 RepID=UPI0036D78D10